MDLIRPSFPKELIDQVSKNYSQNCFGCEYLRILEGMKTNVCVIGDRICKVDVLYPTLTNPACKFNASKNPFAYSSTIDTRDRI